MNEQALGCRLVFAEVPDAPEERQKRCEASLWTRGHAVCPQLLRDLWRIAFGHRPGAWWVHDQRTPTWHEPLVIGGVVPTRCIRREELSAAFVIVECLPHAVTLHRNLLVGIDQHRSEGVEDRTSSVDRVGCCAETNAEGKPGFMTRFSSLDERVERPVFRLGRTAGRIHRLHIDTGVLLHKIYA